MLFSLPRVVATKRNEEKRKEKKRREENNNKKKFFFLKNQPHVSKKHQKSHSQKFRPFCQRSKRTTQRTTRLHGKKRAENTSCVACKKEELRKTRE